MKKAFLLLIGALIVLGTIALGIAIPLLLTWIELNFIKDTTLLIVFLLNIVVCYAVFYRGGDNGN